ncbi:hypothetical protein AGMMS4952_03510 [Spirochaetia bacterium]|nr:hypothetical protein AGMMS4952_03510 [Spirochaetia bacterium]
MFGLPEIDIYTGITPFLMMIHPYFTVDPDTTKASELIIRPTTAAQPPEII